MTVKTSRRARTDRWAGIDVGGCRKGFHAALIDDERVIELLASTRAIELAGWLREWGAALVAVDSPGSPAPDGERSRAGERSLVAARICSLRHTPDRRALKTNPGYYEWIEQGFLLYDEPGKAGLAAVECFPTASFTRWAGPRGNGRRSEWTKAALAARGLADLPEAMNQDQRDAVAAALTARGHAAGQTERFGDIVVPLSDLARPLDSSSPGESSVAYGLFYREHQGAHQILRETGAFAEIERRCWHIAPPPALRLRPTSQKRSRNSWRLQVGFQRCGFLP